MYQSIYNYSLDHQLSLPKYRKEKKIVGYIKLSSNGDYEGLEKVPKEEVKRIWCPHISDSKPAIICEKAQFIFPSDDAAASSQKRHDGFLKLTEEGTKHSETLASIWRFLQKVEDDADFRAHIQSGLTDAGIKITDFISFRIDEINAENKTDWAAWFDQYAETHTPKKHNTNMVVSELTGKRIVPIMDKFPPNTAQIAGTGFPLFSNQHRKVSGDACSFVSYGCVNGIACPMSQEEADAVNAGLKELLDSDIHNDKDFGLIYWYDRNDAMDLITRARTQRRRSSKKGVDEAEEERAGQYTAVLQSVFSGININPIEDYGKYHIVEYNLPDKGRVSLSREYMGTYQDLYDSLQKWYRDTTYRDVIWIDGKPSGTADYTIGNVCAVLFQCLQRKNVSALQKEADIEYGPDKRKLIRSMLFGEAIPDVFLRNATMQLSRSYVCSEKFKDERRSRRILLQVIKACLLRKGYRDIKETLNMNTDNIGYQCGRWFAAMVMAQELASNQSLNVTMAGKYYRSAKKTPARTFAMINDLKEHYLSKMPSGSRIMMERTFAEIAGEIGTAFPDKFDLAEQGAFDLGYAQQRQAFFTRSENNQEQDTD